MPSPDGGWPGAESSGRRSGVPGSASCWWRECSWAAACPPRGCRGWLGPALGVPGATEWGPEVSFPLVAGWRECSWAAACPPHGCRGWLGPALGVPMGAGWDFGVSFPLVAGWRAGVLPSDDRLPCGCRGWLGLEPGVPMGAGWGFGVGTPLMACWPLGASPGGGLSTPWVQGGGWRRPLGLEGREKRSGNAEGVPRSLAF